MEQFRALVVPAGLAVVDNTRAQELRVRVTQALPQAT